MRRAVAILSILVTACGGFRLAASPAVCRSGTARARVSGEPRDAVRARALDGGGDDAGPGGADSLKYAFGAGALSTATAAWVRTFAETHHPGLAVSALCLVGCWAALATKFAETRRGAAA